ncbi:MAG TPA: signal peptidase II [Gemmatimonadaceae bacterium]|nr:signal peptidase II [Gemmatimonadaceae bacterium]
MPQRDQHLATFTAVALLVVFGDLVTKDLAVALLADGGSSLGALGHALGERVRLTVLANAQGAFGMSYGPHTWSVNVGLTLASIALMAPVCGALARVHAGAPRSLGLIAGAAGGNLISLLTSPHGVPDFIAVDRGGGHELVFNVADVAAYVGILLMARVALAIVQHLREGERATAPVGRHRG